MIPEGLYNVRSVGILAKNPTPNGEYPWYGWFSAAKSALKTHVGLFFPPGLYSLEYDEVLEVNNGQILMGTGKESVLYQNGQGTLPMIRVDGKKDVTIKEIALTGGQTSKRTHSCIEIKGAANNVRIKDVRCSDGYAGVWAKEGKDIHIINCEFSSLSHAVYLGNQDDALELLLRDVLICNCLIGDSEKLEGSDGIKTLGRCHNLIIDGNLIRNTDQDAIDLFASGDRVVISNNVLFKNGANGIDIKTDYTGYPEKWGHQGQNVVIVGNMIYANAGFGIKVWASYNVKGTYRRTPFHILIMSNHVSKNGYNGIENQAPYLSVFGNLIIENGLTFVEKLNSQGNLVPVHFHGVFFFSPKGGSVDLTLLNGIVCGNIVVNNGRADRDNAGVHLSNAQNIVVSGNLLVNAKTLPNAYQNYGFSSSNSKGVLLTNNHFGPGDAKKNINPGDSDFVAVNNIGLKNRKGLARFSRDEIEKMKKEGAAKVGELVFVTDLSDEQLKTYSSLAYFDGRHWLFLLKN